MRHSNRRTLITLILAGSIALSIGTSHAGALDRATDHPPRLDTPTDLNGLQSFRARGSDPSPPRELTLWSWEGTQFRRLATTRSTSEGEFDFGEQPIPIGTSEFHVAVAGQEPDRSRGIQLERRLPGPIVVASDSVPLEITLIPALVEGAIRIHDAHSGRLLFHRVIDLRSPHGQTVDLEAEGLSRQSDWLSIEQILDDGRRSQPTLLRLPDP
jgi:hypothetical protein